ncbi:hypothetical protein BD309DRAFT_596987 [Dichomitus squalens]|nr:hypothetical protein BD309DRAFT_596987 [Dichomitus squalens]
MNPSPVDDGVEIITLSLSPHRERGQYHARGTTRFPIAEVDTLHFVSGGVHCSGFFEVTQSGDPGAEEFVVNIDAFFRAADALNEVLVRRLHPAQGEYGVGVYTGDGPNALNRDKAVRFRVQLRLPAPDYVTAVPLRIQGLSTFMPLFSHHLHELARSVFFGQVALNTSDASIETESLAGENVSFVTVNGGVRGTLLVSERLTVATRNGPIHLTADLMNDVSGLPTFMSLQTTNGPIEANVSLTSTAPSVRGGSFDVTANTTNGPLRVAFQDGPANSVLNASLQTCNAPAYVVMHSMFEGRYELQGSPFLRPTVGVGTSQDPTGTGRRRNVTAMNEGMGVVRGQVRLQPVPYGFDGQDGHAGYVRVRTTNGPLHASL